MRDMIIRNWTYYQRGGWCYVFIDHSMCFNPSCFIRLL